MDRDKLIQEAKKFDYWFFPYELGNGKRIHATERLYETLHYQKLEHIFKPTLEHICGNNLKGKTVLDCGCNSGFFSFECARRGAKYILGLEGKESALQQAKLLNEYFKFSNLEFRKADISSINVNDVHQFDIVLLLGVIYYLENPIAFIREIGKVAKRDIVIDTEVIHFENAMFHLVFPTNPKFGGLSTARLLPSTGAVKAMLYLGGFKSYYVLNTDPIGQEYKARLALVASKEIREGFMPLEDKPFIVNMEFGAISPTTYAPSKGLSVGGQRQWWKRIFK